MKTIRALGLAVTALIIAIAFAPSSAIAATYYVNNQAGSNCSDGGPGSSAQPWCTLAKVNAHGAYGPGDSILLARGATWNEQLELTGSGTSSAWITLGAYGSGNNPRIIRNQGNNEIAARITNPDYWWIQHLEVGNAAVGLYLYFSTTGHQGVRVSDLYAHDIKGIAGGHDTSYPNNGGGTDPWTAANAVAESSGLHVIASDSLSLSSKSDYVAKNLYFEDIRGAHNTNTIRMNSNVRTPDFQKSTGFQDVQIAFLDVDTDDGNAAPQYQTAGLGCANSLSIVGAARVIVRDSRILQGASCFTKNGTSEVFIGFVEDTTFVNNTFVYTPPTGSGDETAIDYEYWEKNVTVWNNFFAANGGAGIEILDIHSEDIADQVSTLIDSNVFSNNNLFQPPGSAGPAASIRQTGNSAVPVATLSNNLYNEPNRTFFGADQGGGTTQSNNLPVPSTANFAGAQFTNTQGANQWSYQYLTGSIWNNMPNFSTGYPTGGFWYNTGNQYVSRTAMAPTIGGDVARVWTAPYAGVVSIRGRLLKADIGNGVYAGNGVTGAIYKLSGSAMTQVWPTSGGPQVIGGLDQVGASTSLDNVTVAAGDQLRFVVGTNGGDNAYDTVSWSPAVGYVSSPTTPYYWTFSTDRDFEGWMNAYQLQPSVANGAMTLTSSGGDPNIISRDNLNVPASIRYLHLRLKNQTGDGASKIYFSTTASPTLSESKSVNFATPTNATGYTDVIVDLGSNSLYTGTIKQIRLDPFSTTGVMVVDSMSLSTN